MGLELFFVKVISILSLEFKYSQCYELELHVIKNIFKSEIAYAWMNLKYLTSHESKVDAKSMDFISLSNGYNTSEITPNEALYQIELLINSTSKNNKLIRDYYLFHPM